MFKPTGENDYHLVTDTKHDRALSVTDPKCSLVETSGGAGDGTLPLDCGLTITSCNNRSKEAYDPYKGVYRCFVQQRVTAASFGVTSDLSE